MKANSVAIGAGSSSVKIEQRTAKLLIAATYTAANKTYTDFETLFAGTNIEVIKQTESGQKTIIQKRKLTDLLEIASHDEGAVMVFETAANVKVAATVELSDFGAIALLNNEYFQVNFENVPADCSIDLYAMDFPVQSNRHNVYEDAFFNANSAKEISVSDVKALCLPADTIVKVELYYPNGRTWLLEKEEVKRLAQETNPESFNIDGKVTSGGRKFYCLDIKEAVTAKITLDTAGNVVCLSYETL